MTDQAELLGILNAHGKQFLQSFDLPNVGSSGKRKATGNLKASRSPSSSKRRKFCEDQPDSKEERGEIQSTDSEAIVNDSKLGSDSDTNDSDDGFTANSSATADDKVIFFSEKSFQSEAVSKSQMKAFMSSKVSKLRGESSTTSQLRKKTPQEEEDERTNAENDALLHKLVHTRLLSGSLDPNLDITSAHRRKALAGRVRELTGEVRLGKGEKAVRHTERNKAGKRVREGLVLKQKEREKQELEEAKNLGNYHPTLKKHFGGPEGPKPQQPRSRGLTMGIGKFRAGVLQLSKQEIASVAGPSRHPGGKRGHKRK